MFAEVRATATRPEMDRLAIDGEGLPSRIRERRMRRDRPSSSPGVASSVMPSDASASSSVTIGPIMGTPSVSRVSLSGRSDDPVGHVGALARRSPHRELADFPVWPRRCLPLGEAMLATRLAIRGAGDLVIVHSGVSCPARRSTSITPIAEAT